MMHKCINYSQICVRLGCPCSGKHEKKLVVVYDNRMDSFGRAKRRGRWIDDIKKEIGTKCGEVSAF